MNLLFLTSGIIKIWERSPGISNIVRGLAEKGFEIDVLSLAGKENKVSIPALDILNINMHFINASKKNPYAFIPLVKNLLKEKKIKAIIGEILNLSAILSLCLDDEIKFIAHEIRMPKNYKVRIIKRALRGNFSLFEAIKLIRNVKDLVKKVSKVVSNSKALNSAVIKAFNLDPNKCLTIYRGIDTEFFSFKKRKDINSFPELLFVGNIKPHKGVEDLFEALSFIDKPVRLILCGKGEPEYIEFLKSKTKNYKVPHQVCFKGFLNPSELLKYYHSCDLFVFPSHTEGMPRALLEAMSCGCLVVCSNIAPHKEAVINDFNGIIVEVKSPKSLAQGIQKYLNNPQIVETISINARKTIEKNFSKESEINKWAELITQEIAYEN